MVQNNKKPSLFKNFFKNVDEIFKAKGFIGAGLFAQKHTGSSVQRRGKKAGLPPGALVYVGKKLPGPVRITVIDYSDKKFEEKEVKDIEECFPFKNTPTITWINIDGTHDVKTIEKIGNHFGVHPLILEDILNTNQRPKVQDMGAYVYIVLRMFSYLQDKHRIVSEQVSLILGKNFVISFQESDDWDVFDSIRLRLRNKQGRIRKLGPDYLTYSMIDAIVDNYFIILENFGERVEYMHGELLENPKKEVLHTINIAKREMIELRKSIWPLREVVGNLERGDTNLVQKSTLIYLRDVYDHIIQVIDTIETLRDTLSSMLDIYLSSVSNKMNEIMKVLTIISTIFIPLTFLSGVYGMNFRYMPELEQPHGYFFILGVMMLVAIVMLIFFRKKKWI
ncbi:MAG: magnesium/cobalt transporter CorA [Nanoarchaeota archaeon]